MAQRSEDLWLENQICFPLYATSRLITKLYTPLLDDLGITYPQYLVLLVLWKEDHKTVTNISEQLLLETNTLTPLLQRMEAKELIYRKRSEDDERKVVVSLTKQGKALKRKALCIPDKIVAQLSDGKQNAKDAKQLHASLHQLLEVLKQQVAAMD